MESLTETLRKAAMLPERLVAPKRPSRRTFNVRIVFEVGRRKPLIYCPTAKALKEEAKRIKACSEGELPWPFRPSIRFFDMKITGVPSEYHARKKAMADFREQHPQPKAPRLHRRSHGGRSPYPTMLPRAGRAYGPEAA